MTALFGLFVATPGFAACVPGRFTVALDVGHFRGQPGATSAVGISEFDYNLAVARTALGALARAGFGSAFLIGESGETLALGQRTRIAAERGADLFLSLHHDSVQPQYLSSWMVGGRVQRYSDLFHGYSIFLSARGPRFDESRRFATALGDALLGEGLAPSAYHAEDIPGEGRPVVDLARGIFRYDGLAVLRTARMPAALLETAVIVNRAEERAVSGGDYHGRVAAAIVRSVRSVCERGVP